MKIIASDSSSESMPMLVLLFNAIASSVGVFLLLDLMSERRAKRKKKCVTSFVCTQYSEYCSAVVMIAIHFIMLKYAHKLNRHTMPENRIMYFQRLCFLYIYVSKHTLFLPCRQIPFSSLVHTVTFYAIA